MQQVEYITTLFDYKMFLEPYSPFCVRYYAWLACKWLSTNFLGNKKGLDYEDSASSRIDSYKELRCCVLIKSNISHSNFDFFLRIQGSK